MNKLSPSRSLRFSSARRALSALPAFLLLAGLAAPLQAGSFVPVQWQRLSSGLPSYRAVEDSALDSVAADVTAAPIYTFLNPPHRLINDFSMRLGFPYPNTYGSLAWGDLDPGRAATGLDFHTKLNFNRTDSSSAPNLVWGFHWGPGLQALAFTPTTDTTSRGIFVTIGATPRVIGTGTVYEVRCRINGPDNYTVFDNGFLASDQPAGLMNDAPADQPDGGLDVHILNKPDGTLQVSTEYLDASGSSTTVFTNFQSLNLPLGTTLSNTSGWRAVTGCRSYAGNFHFCTMNDTSGGTEVTSTAPYSGELKPGTTLYVPGDYGFSQLSNDATFVNLATLPGQVNNVVRLVPDAGSKLGQLLFAPGLQDMLPTRLTAQVRLKAAGDPADGFAISFGEYGTEASTFNEEGAPSGLVYSFDLFENTDLREAAPGITARFNGVDIGYVAVPPATLMAGGQFQNLEASLDPSNAWVRLNGQRYNFPLTGNLSGKALSPSHSSVVLSARTGGLSSEVLVSTLKVYATDYVKPRISLDGPNLLHTGRLDYSTDLRTWNFTRSAFSSFPLKALGYNAGGPRVFYRAVSLGRPTPVKE